MSPSSKLTYTDLERSRELRAAFDQLVFESLRPLTLGLGSLFLLFTGIDAFTMGLGAVMALAAFFSAAITFTFYYWLTQNKIASQFSHPLLALLCALITLNVVLDYALRGNPAQIIYLLMLVIGAGFIFLSMRWLLFVLVISVGSWTGVSWLTGYALGLTPSAVEIIAAIVLALLMHNARLRVVGRLEELRLKDIQQNNALQHALQKAQQSEELARQQNEYLTALHRTTLTVINQLDLNELLETLLKRAGQLLGTEHGYIYLVTPDGAALERQVAVGLFAQLAGTRLMMGQGITGKVWESGQSLNVDHYDQWENRAPTFQANTIRAAVGVPLKIGERVSGVLGLAHGATIKRTFNHTEVVLLEQFAQLAAIAIENARLFSTEQQHARALDMILQATLSLTSSLALREVLDTIALSTFTLLNEPRLINIFLYEQGRLTFGAALQNGQHLDHPFSEPRPGGLTYTIAATGEPLIIADMKTHPLYANTPSDWQGAIVGLPLKIGARVVGVMNCSYDEARGFSEEDLRVLRVLGDQAAVAIENARLYEEATRRANELAALTAIGHEISATLDLDKVLQLIAERARAVLKTDTISLHLAQPNQQMLRATVVSGNFAEQIKNADLAIGEGFTGHVAATGVAAIMNEPESDLQQARAPTPPADHGAEVMMAAPLLARGAVIGVMTVWRQKTQGLFTSDDLNFMVGLCRQAAIAIENARLYTTAQQELVERKRTEAALQLAKDSAEAASRAKSTFLATMSHELRTPLSQIIGYTEILREEAAERNLPDLEADLQKIHKAGQTLLDIIADVLELARLEAGKMDLELETFDVARVVQAVVMTAQPLIEKNRNQLTVHCATGLGAMRSDRGKVQHALYHLLSNAAKFTQNGSVTLTITRQRERVVNGNGSEAENLPLVAPYPPLHSDWLVFRVSDTGIGMTPEQIEKIFNAFAQADSSSKRLFGGVGVGLAITKHFCRLMGGDINAMSIYNRSSTFTMQLPAIAPVAPDPTPTETPASSHG
jgi:signal transduction histidine kinase